MSPTSPVGGTHVDPTIRYTFQLNAIRTDLVPIIFSLQIFSPIKTLIYTSLTMKFLPNARGLTVALMAAGHNVCRRDTSRSAGALHRD